MALKSEYSDVEKFKKDYEKHFGVEGELGSNNVKWDLVLIDSSRKFPAYIMPFKSSTINTSNFQERGYFMDMNSRGYRMLNAIPVPSLDLKKDTIIFRLVDIHPDQKYMKEKMDKLKITTYPSTYDEYVDIVSNNDFTGYMVDLTVNLHPFRINHFEEGKLLKSYKFQKK